MPTQMWAVQAGLLAAFTAPAAAAPARLFDGQRKTGTAPKLYLIVGSDTDDPFEDPGVDVVDVLAATAEQEWAREGSGRWRTERGAVFSTIVAWSGGTVFAPLRAAAASLLKACELVLRADPSLGGVLEGPGAELGEIRAWERRNAKGTAVGVVFSVTYQSTLT